MSREPGGFWEDVFKIALGVHLGMLLYSLNKVVFGL